MPNAHPRPYHRDSTYGDGPRRPLDREQRARFTFLLRAHHRAGRITRAGRDIGTALLRRLAVDGRCDPGHVTLAGDAGCDERTVRRGLDAMKRLGLVIWQRRIVRSGWAVRQTSNSYVLVPTETPNPPAIRAVRCGGHSGQLTPRKSFQTVANGPSEGSDEWGQWNRDRQLALLMGAR